MKNLMGIMTCLISLSTFAQEQPSEFDGNNWKAPYTLPVPAGWNIERFLIPIVFAPQIPYQGVEDLRFTPGWGKAVSEEYWTYAFLWYLDGTPETNEKIIEENLKAYYTGLIGSNIETRNIPPEKIIPTKTSVKETMTDKGDLKTYAGTIEMLDYMQQKPITLNCIVHLKSCSEQSKTFIFHEISPMPLTANIWQSLNDIWTGFDCKASDVTK